MKRILFILIVVGIGVVSCNKKDTYGYTCRCNNQATGQSDTIYTIRVQTSGEAAFRCEDYADTANAYGKNIACKID